MDYEEIQLDTQWRYNWIGQGYSPKTSLAGDSGGTQNIVNVRQDNKAHGNIKIKL